MKNLKGIIKKFKQVKILVVGDLILDEYIRGSVERISPEAPVPVLWADRREYVPGGTANVANNISSLKGKVTLLGVTGDDANSRILLGELKKRKINTDSIFIERDRHTTVKTRILAGHQQVVRVDWEHTHDLTGEVNTKILKFIEKNIGLYDGIIIEDYGKGVINVALLEKLIAFSRKYKKIITVDPKEENFRYYRGVTSITPNRKELENAVRNLKIQDTANRFKIRTDKLFTDNSLNQAAGEILEYLNLDSILVTLGEHGMKLLENNGRLTHIPTQAQEVFDVSGAGDTVISTFTLALCAGSTKLEAAHIANFAAGIVVGKSGTAVTTCDELLARIK